jgi:hypothetical protein
MTTRIEDEATNLAYWLANQMGEHVDAQDDETLTETVQRYADRNPGRDSLGVTTYLDGLARAWWLVTAACVAAFAGCVAATGAALVVANALTWHTLVTTGLALAWLGGGLLSAVAARRFGRQARRVSAELAQADL